VASPLGPCAALGRGEKPPQGQAPFQRAPAPTRPTQEDVAAVRAELRELKQALATARQQDVKRWGQGQGQGPMLTVAWPHTRGGIEAAVLPRCPRRWAAEARLKNKKYYNRGAVSFPPNNSGDMPPIELSTHFTADVVAYSRPDAAKLGELLTFYGRNPAAGFAEVKWILGAQ
jgi:hypothetical protein